MKSFIVMSLILSSQIVTAGTVTTVPAQKTTAYVNSSKVKVRLSYKKTISVCDAEHLSLAINALDYVDQSNADSALEKKVFVAESRVQRVGSIPCDTQARKIVTVTSPWTEIDLSQGRHTNMVEIFHDAGQRLDIQEI